LTFVLPFCVWTLRGFLLGIPKELEEAAMVDGSTRLGVFIKILLPLMGPGLVATSVFAFITTWNEYIFARVLLNDQSKQTVRSGSPTSSAAAATPTGRVDGRLDADGDPGSSSSSCSSSGGLRSADIRGGARVSDLSSPRGAVHLPELPGDQGARLGAPLPRGRRWRAHPLCLQRAVA